MFTLRDLPVDERPRERLIKYGVESLSLQELFALIFGRGTKNQPIMAISQKLLSKFGSLQNILETSIEDLETIKGIGLAKACQLKACFEISRRLNNNSLNIDLSPIEKVKLDNNIGPEKIYLEVRSRIVNFHKEHLVVVSLDNRNKIIGVDTVSVGILNSNLVHPRETFEAAIKRHAAQIVICHNHPSGVLIPSGDDIEITKDLISAGNILDIHIIDHIIITKEGYYSFAKNNLINFNLSN